MASSVTVRAAALAALVASASGALTTWNSWHRVYPAYFGETAPTAEGSRIDARVDNGNWVFRVATAADTLRGVSILLDVDLDGFTDMEVRFGDQGAAPVLYKGGVVGQVAAFEWLGAREGEFALTPSEVSSTSQLTPKEDFGVMARLNNNEQAPPNLDTPFPVYSALDDPTVARSCRTEGVQRGGVVFSSDMQEAFYDGKAYMQLALNAQSQLMQAGVPHDLVDLPDLLNLENTCKWSVVVVPFLRQINPAQLWALERALFFVVHVHGGSLIVAGDLASVDLSEPSGVAIRNIPYTTLARTIGLKTLDPPASAVSAIEVRVAPHEAGKAKSVMFRDKVDFELLMDGTSGIQFTSFFGPADDSGFEVTTLAVQEVVRAGETGVETFTAVHGTKLNRAGQSPLGMTSGRSVHFATPEMIANGDLLWRAVRWTIEKDAADVQFGLQMTRNTHMMAMRNDMDQSMFYAEASKLSPLFYAEFVSNWHARWNMVGSYFINVGNREDLDIYTKWDEARTWYSNYLKLGNEMGSHSYTHPNNFNELDDATLKYEFEDAAGVIKTELSLSRIGTAQPGTAETLATMKRIEQYFPDYFSGGYAGVGDGFPHAFGFYRPGSDMVYMAPNIYFDFTLIQFAPLLTPEEAKAEWLRQLTSYTKSANMAILHWPIHDYGPPDWNDETNEAGTKGLYNRDMFEALIDAAWVAGTEFVTCMDLSDRIKALANTALAVVKTGTDEYVATVTPAVFQPVLGRMAVSMINPDAETPKVIASVENYYAYSATKVFMPKAGGYFKIKLADKEPAVQPTRISELGMRMELDSIAGDGVNLAFTVRGMGSVWVTLQSGATDVVITGGLVKKRVGDVIEFAFSSPNTIATIDIKAKPGDTVVPTSAPVMSPTSAPSANETNTENTSAPSKSPEVSPSPSPAPAPSPSPAPADPPMARPPVASSPSDDTDGDDDADGDDDTDGGEQSVAVRTMAACLAVAVAAQVAF